MEERITKMKSVTCDTTEPTTPAAVLKVAVNAVPSDCRMVAAEGTLGTAAEGSSPNCANRESAS